LKKLCKSWDFDPVEKQEVKEESKGDNDGLKKLIVGKMASLSRR
jgi:hypothetical protein